MNQVKKMNGARIKPAPPFANRDEFESAVDRVCGLDLQIREVVSQAEADIATIRAESEELAAPIRGERDALAVRCQAYAETHRGHLLPGRAKSATTAQGKWGFRLQKIWRWPTDLLAKLRKKGALQFVRVSESPDKSALKKADSGFLAGLGVNGPEDSDTFFIEPKRERRDGQ